MTDTLYTVWCEKRLFFTYSFKNYGKINNDNAKGDV